MAARWNSAAVAKEPMPACEVSVDSKEIITEPVAVVYVTLSVIGSPPNLMGRFALLRPDAGRP